jgi:hypothetical protein
MTLKKAILKNRRKIIHVFLFMIVLTAIDLFMTCVILQSPYTYEKNLWASWIFSNMDVFGYVLAFLFVSIFLILVLSSIVVYADYKYGEIEEKKDTAINISFMIIAVGYFIISFVNLVQSWEIMLSLR